MRVAIEIDGYSPPGMFTDIRVSADNDWEPKMLGDVGKPLYLQSEMIRLLKDAVGQICRVYQVEPTEFFAVAPEPPAPPKPAPVRMPCMQCAGTGRWLALWKCHPCEGKGYVMSS